MGEGELDLPKSLMGSSRAAKKREEKGAIIAEYLCLSYILADGPRYLCSGEGLSASRSRLPVRHSLVLPFFFCPSGVDSSLFHSSLPSVREHRGPPRTFNIP